MNYPQEVADLFTANPIEPIGLNNIYSLHRYIDRHLKIIRDVALTARKDFAFSDKPFTDLLKVLEDVLIWIQEDPERHSQMLVDDDDEISNDPA
jgi:hypothetical protein